MFEDFVMPKNNETEFIEIASKLGIRKLYFLYNFEDYGAGISQKKIQSFENKKIRIETGSIANSKNLNQAHKQSNLIVVKSSEKDRIMIENRKINLLYGFEELNRKDYLHQRASGLNHVMCEVARKNNIAIGFSYSSLFHKDNGALAIGRMKQNIKLCQKYKIKTAIGAFTSNPFELRLPYDVCGLFRILGMNISKNKSF